MPWSTSNRLERLPPWWSSFTVKYLKEHTRCSIRYKGCLGIATEVDHKIPGDNHNLQNLQPACRRCHSIKSSIEGNRARSKYKALKKRPNTKHPGKRI